MSSDDSSPCIRCVPGYDRATHGRKPSPAFLWERPLTQAAFECALAAHRGQQLGADEVPYVLHPLEVAATLDAHGFDDSVTAAAILHDTLEDTDLTAETLEERFGVRVAHLVRALTEDAAIGSETERKAALREQVADKDVETAAVFAADKLSKVRELRIRLSRRPEDVDQREVRLKLDHYRHSLAMLHTSLGEHPLVRLLRFELEAL